MPTINVTKKVAEGKANSGQQGSYMQTWLMNECLGHGQLQENQIIIICWNIGLANVYSYFYGAK